MIFQFLSFFSIKSNIIKTPSDNFLLYNVLKLFRIEHSLTVDNFINNKPSVL